MNKEDYQKNIKAIQEIQNFHFIISLIEIGIGFLLAFGCYLVENISVLSLICILFASYAAIVNILKIHEGEKIIWVLKDELSKIQN